MKTKIFVMLSVIVGMLVVTSMIGVAQEVENSAVPEEQAPEQDVAISKIDINSATLEELESLAGIGPKLAQMIIDGRPYEKVEDLLNVKGIAEKKLEQFKDLIEVKPIEEQSGEEVTEEQAQ
jgi:competence ComEA-like helix-hairpin-helix protein